MNIVAMHVVWSAFDYDRIGTVVVPPNVETIPSVKNNLSLKQTCIHISGATTPTDYKS